MLFFPRLFVDQFCKVHWKFTLCKVHLGTIFCTFSAPTLFLPACQNTSPVYNFIILRCTTNYTFPTTAASLPFQTIYCVVHQVSPSWEHNLFPNFLSLTICVTFVSPPAICRNSFAYCLDIFHSSAFDLKISFFEFSKVKVQIHLVCTGQWQEWRLPCRKLMSRSPSSFSSRGGTWVGG